MVGSLRELLAGGMSGNYVSEHLPTLLSVACCVPRDPAERALAAAHAVPLPAELPAGCALLVSFTPPDSRALWLFAPRDPGPEERPLGFEARETWREARLLGSGALPVLGAPAVPGSIAAGSARLLVQDGAGAPPVLDRRSYGLALVLAEVARCVGLPVPADLVALASLGREGALERVDDLPGKLDTVRRWAPGVGRVLVAREQQREAEGRGFAVHAVATVDDAVALAFPDVVEALLNRWRADRDEASRQADHLWGLVLDEELTLRSWVAVGRAAELLLEAVDPAGEDRERLEFVRAVAWRHAGRIVPLPDPPRGAGRNVRFRVLAHGVQQATDACAADWEEWVAFALSKASKDSEDDEGSDLVVLGAVGRAYAAWCRTDEAEPFLRRAVAGWLNRREPKGASIPLCELLRILGIGERRDAIRGLADHEVRKVEAACEAGSHFLWLALGRAWIQVGDPAAGLAILADEARGWDLGPLHTPGARLQWFARGLDLVRCEREAERVRSRLAALAERDPRHAGFAARLADLQARLHRGAPDAELDAALSALKALPGEAPFVDRILACVGAPDLRRAAEEVCRWYPY